MSALNTRRRIMPLNERERLQREIGLDQQDMSGEIPEASRAQKKYLMRIPGEENMLNVNRKALAQKIKALRDGQPDSISKHERVKMEKEEKELAEWCSKRMVPVEDVQLRPSEKGVSTPDFVRAVNHMSKNEHSPEFMEKANRLKNIRRQLNPDDPMAGNLEHIRPRRSSPAAA